MSDILLPRLRDFALRKLDTVDDIFSEKQQIAGLYKIYYDRRLQRFGQRFKCDTGCCKDEARSLTDK